MKSHLFGLSTYSSFTDINDEDFAESDWHRFSYSSSFGIGLGTHYTVSESTYLDFRIKYLPGAADQYYRLKDNRDEWDIDIDNYRLDVSKTDVSYMSIGLVFKL